MPRKQWPLDGGRPVIDVVLTLAPSGQTATRRLLADTGAGTDQAGFELILNEQACGGIPAQPVSLGGAYSGAFAVYLVRVPIPQIGFDRHVRAVGVAHTPQDLDGIACFRFLNRFTYGNLGDPAHFALEL